MNLQLLHPDRFDIPTLANMVGTPGVFADFLFEALLGVPMQEQLTDVLLLYARDAITVHSGHMPDCGTAYRGCAPGCNFHQRLCEKCGAVGEHLSEAGRKCDRCGSVFVCKIRALFPVHFTEQALGTWLQVAGDVRAQKVQEGTVFDYVSVSNDFSYGRGQRELSAARLDLKRRVLGMFGEVDRRVFHQHKAAAEGCGVTEVLHPIDFLPTQIQQVRPDGGDTVLNNYLDQLRDEIAVGLGIPAELVRGHFGLSSPDNP